MRVRRGLAAGLLLGAACNERPAPPVPAVPSSNQERPSPSPSPSSSASAQPSASPLPSSAASAAPLPEIEIEIDAELAAAAVDRKHFARAVLYTWTTKEQIDELAHSKVLLSRTKSPRFGPSFFDVARIHRGAPISYIFDEPALAKRRFAWTNPWATLLGADAAGYGDRLVRVVLKKDAIIAQYDPDMPWIWAFSDLEGHPISRSKALAEAHRIAAVYHVYAGADGAAFREYVLCNESMIEEWSVNTDEIHAALDASVAALRRVRAAIEREPPKPREPGWGRLLAQQGWSAEAVDRTPAGVYEANLAFTGDAYTISPAAIDGIVRALLAVPRGAPLSHSPTAVFPGFNPAVRGNLETRTIVEAGKSILVKCVPFGTFGCYPLR